MPKYEFSLVVTDVELSEEQQVKVSRAVALAGTSELGSVLPPEYVTAPVDADPYWWRHWCGLPRTPVELPLEFGVER